MSNLIKAQQISYAEKIRTLDMNERSEELRKAYIDQYITNNIANRQIDFGEVSRKLEEERILTSDDVDFSPGLIADQINVIPEETQEDDSQVVTLESRLREKRRELEEIKAEIMSVQEEAARIIDNANEEAKNIADNALAEIEVQREQIFNEAREEGYEDGRAAGMQEAQQALEEAQELKERYTEEYEKQVDELEPAFVEILINYVQKLTGIYADDKRDIIIHLMENAMKGKKGIENFIVHVSETDYAMASYSKDSIRGYLSEGSNLEIVADKMLTKNQCMIETESRIFDCSLDSQMMGLIEDIRLLAEKE